MAYVQVESFEIPTDKESLPTAHTQNFFEKQNNK